MKKKKEPDKEGGRDNSVKAQTKIKIYKFVYDFLSSKINVAFCVFFQAYEPLGQSASMSDMMYSKESRQDGEDNDGKEEED